jgi:hypothetical protein
MATHAGSEGVVKIGSNTVAEVRNWSLSESAETIEDTAMGASARTFKSGLTSANGSLTCYWDETDTSGQGAMTIGAEVTLNLYPEGATSGDTYATLTAIVTSAEVSGSFDGMVEASFGFDANGAVTWGTVA